MVLKNGQVEFDRLEPSSKQVLQLTDRPDWMLKYQQKAELRQAVTATVSLEQAIHTAERAQGAPAVAAGIARMPASSQVHAYNVMLDSKVEHSGGSPWITPRARLLRTFRDTSSGQHGCDGRTRSFSHEHPHTLGTVVS